MCVCWCGCFGTQLHNVENSNEAEWLGGWLAMLDWAGLVWAGLCWPGWLFGWLAGWLPGWLAVWPSVCPPGHFLLHCSFPELPFFHAQVGWMMKTGVC